MKGKDKGSRQASGSNVDPPKKNQFYSLCSRDEQECSPNVVTGMLQFFYLDMVNFDVILGMDWLHDYFASIYCRTRIIKSNFPNELVLEWKG